MRELNSFEINDVSGARSSGLFDSLLGGVTSTLVGAAVGVFGGAKRGSEYAGKVQNNDPITGGLGVVGSVLGTAAGAVGGLAAGAVGGLGMGLANGMSETDVLTDHLNNYFDQALQG